MCSRARGRGSLANGPDNVISLSRKCGIFSISVFGRLVMDHGGFRSDTRRNPSRNRPRRVLPWLMFCSDGSSLCRRNHELALDCWPGDPDTSEKLVPAGSLIPRIVGI